jgi:hypothetical protein
MGMSRQQADAVVAELELEEQFEAAFDAFVSQGGDAVARYFSGTVEYENGKKIAQWGIANLPNGIHSLTTPAGFEIAFQNCKAALVANPNWRSAREIYKYLEPRLTAAQFKAICTAEDVRLSADLAASLVELGGSEVFRQYADGVRKE